MESPLDGFFLSLAISENAELYREINNYIQIIGAVAFVSVWLLGVLVGLRDVIAAFRGGMGFSTFFHPFEVFSPLFLITLVSLFLIWMIPGWALVLTGFGLASEEAIEVFLGYDAIFVGGE